MGRGGSQGWLVGLPADAVAEVHRIQGGGPSRRRPTGLGSNWWLRRSPTTGPARDAALQLRSGRVVLGEWPIVVAGKVQAHGPGQGPDPSGVLSAGGRVDDAAA